MSSIRLEHIDKAYDDNQILKDFSVEIDSHEMISVIGGSGSGKTTMLKLINGLLLPDQGHVYIDGIDIQTINQNELRRHIGYVIQNIGLFPHMNIEDNISYVLRLQKTDPQMIKERVHELIVMMDLDQDILKRYPDELSGGQKQRIAIYRGFIANHPVVLCDEPTGALDVKNSEEVFKTLKELAKEKLVIVISHDEKLASKYHDYLYEIKDQQIHLVHQNKIKETITAKEKTTKKSFFQFLLKDFKLCWKSHFIVIQVLFIALLSIMLTLSLTNSTNKQIQAQLEKIIPSTTIMLKKKNNEMLTQKDLQNIHHFGCKPQFFFQPEFSSVHWDTFLMLHGHETEEPTHRL